MSMFTAEEVKGGGKEMREGEEGRGEGRSSKHKIG